MTYGNHVKEVYQKHTASQFKTLDLGALQDFIVEVLYAHKELQDTDATTDEIANVAAYAAQIFKEENE